MNHVHRLAVLSSASRHAMIATLWHHNSLRFGIPFQRIESDRVWDEMGVCRSSDCMVLVETSFCIQMAESLSESPPNGLHFEGLCSKLETPLHAGTLKGRTCQNSASPAASFLSLTSHSSRRRGRSSNSSPAPWRTTEGRKAKEIHRTQAQALHDPDLMCPLRVALAIPYMSFIAVLCCVVSKGGASSPSSSQLPPTFVHSLA